jgi:Stress up-regulated Nod 19
MTHKSPAVPIADRASSPPPSPRSRGRRRPRRVFAALALLVAGLLLATGCEPLVNAPPGGGETLTQTFRYGPFTLGPGGEVEGSPSSGMPRPAGAFGLKSAKFQVVDQNGTPVSIHDVHLHHIVMTTSARDDQLCPGRPERFIGAGMERTPINIWGPYAYLVSANEQWGAIYHLMNETTTTRTVYIEYTLGYQPGANATNSRPVSALFQDVTGCGGSTYDVPGDGGPGSVDSRSRSWTAPRDGLVVFAGGHLHEGGIDITLKDSTANKVLCIGTATYHENPRHLAAINGCTLHEKVIAGHDYSVTSRYDNSEPWEDVMGIYLTYVWWGTQ